MSDRKYKYIKYEKLSDAVRAFEEGEQLYYKNEFGEFAFVKNSVEQFWTHGEYYRRIEAKPFECWLVLDEFSNVKTWGSKKLEGLKPDQKTIWVREVIE